MSEELRPCPFCGSEAQVNTWTMHGITESRCFCSNSDCPNSVRTVALEQWNTRPIEDALAARAKRAEAEVARLQSMVERLIEAGNKLAESVADEWTFSDGKVHSDEWHEWRVGSW